MHEFKVGDRVKRSDADETSIPAYRDMRGAIVAIAESSVLPGMTRSWCVACVEWDCDRGLSPMGRRSNVPLDWLAPAEVK